MDTFGFRIVRKSWQHPEIRALFIAQVQPSTAALSENIARTHEGVSPQEKLVYKVTDAEKERRSRRLVQHTTFFFRITFKLPGCHLYYYYCKGGC